VITLSPRDYELTRALNCSSEFDTLAHESFRVNECGFVSYEFGAKSELLWEETVDILLEGVI
jgi:hypothetical protein